MEIQNNIFISKGLRSYRSTIYAPQLSKLKQLHIINFFNIDSILYKKCGLEIDYHEYQMHKQLKQNFDKYLRSHK